MEIGVLKTIGASNLELEQIENMYSLKYNTNSVQVRSLNYSQYSNNNNIINTDDRFHIIYGGPGTGKSYLIRAFNSAASVLGLKLSITASTGIAAYLINGTTVHSRLRLR
eukprot:NODE_42_length_34079_cov_0.552619.p24 type:complete len:110 gc:universal NODE_42_length_34079_cov_0.552619:17380-17051(-)